jgi:tetratricopeptide (TPR) repeat protein
MAEVLLPKNVATLASSRRRRVMMKTVLLWIGLIALCMVIYQLRGGSLATYHRAAPAPDPSPLLERLLTSMMPVLAVAAVFFFLLRRLRVSPNFVRDTHVAADLLQRGELEQAAARYEDMLERYRKRGAERGFAANGAGYVAMRRGRFDEAIERYRESEAGKINYDAIRLVNAAQLAVLYALRGDLAAAETWLAEVRDRAKNQPIERHELLPDVLFLCRRGQWDEAARKLDTELPLAEGALNGDQLRILRVLRLFVRTQRSSLRDAGALEMEAASLRPARSGLYAWLGAEWPEMQQFLAAQRL